MSTAVAIPGNTASTFLTHFFGSGLADDTYVVERFKTMVDGDIRRCPDDKPGNAQRNRRLPPVSPVLWIFLPVEFIDCCL